VRYAMPEPAVQEFAFAPLTKFVVTEAIARTGRCRSIVCTGAPFFAMEDDPPLVMRSTMRADTRAR
jgi:hypothetical protein